jgi:predicted N-acetyltransferase YhbS
MSTCIVRQAKFHDMKRLWKFSELAYEDLHPHNMTEKWIWQYLKNPYVANKSENLPIWIAEEGDTIVGQIGTIPVKLKIGHLTLDAVWGVDLIVLPSCRGEGIGRQLIENVVKHNQCYAAVDMSDTTRRIYDRLGYIQINPVPVHRKMIKLSSGLVFEYLTLLSKKHAWVNRLNRIVHQTHLSKFLAFLINRAITIQKALKPQIKKTGQVGIHKLKSFGEEIDALWTKVQNQYGIIARRDQTFLNWRFAENVHSHFEAFKAVRQGEITGYIILRRGQLGQRQMGYIVDMLFDRNDEETMAVLLQHAIEVFGDEVEAIECACAVREYHSILNQYGFVKMKESIPYAWCVDEPIRKQMKKLKGEWFITKGDSDWDLGVP